MSEEQFTEDTEGFRSLRAAYEKKVSELKETNKRISDLEQEVTSFRTAQRTQTVAEILEAKGGKPGWAKFYNGEDASEDNISKWLEENANELGWKPGTEETSTTEVDANTLAAQRLAAASFGSQGGIENLQAPNGQVLGDPAEIANAIANLPYEDLQKAGYMPKGGTIFSR